jgi:hypothetical protein
MGQTSYGELTDAEKGALILGSGVLAFPHNDPDIAVDYSGMTGTLTFDQYIDLVNNSTFSLYFKIVATVTDGETSAWTNLSVNAGLVSASGKLLYKWQPKRTVPSSKVIEAVRISVEAYTDAGYSSLYGKDYADYHYYFFSHSSGCTIIDFDDFETIWDGWVPTPSGLGVLIDAFPYTGAYSLRFVEASTDNFATDPSGQTIPTQLKYISKTLNTSGYTSAFLVLHLTYFYDAASAPLPVIRIWTGSKDYIIRIPSTVNTFQPHRIAIPLSISATENVKIAVLFRDLGVPTNCWSYIDSIITVGFH